MAGAVHDAEIHPEVRRQMESILQSPHRLLVYGLLSLTAYFLWGCWYGDVSIYLSGRWLMFNPGQFSGVYTSPVWAIVASVVHDPDVFRVVAFVVTLWAAYSLMESVADRGPASEMLAILAVFYFLWHGVQGYETSLALGLMGILFRGGAWAAYVLPLVRPEAVFVSLLWGGKHRWRSLIPLSVYVAMVVIADNGWSWVRVGNHFEWRYLAVPITFLTLGAARRYGFSGIVVVCMLAGFSLHDEYYKAINESRKGYTFDAITLKPVADYMNATVGAGAVVNSREIQIRRHLRPDIRVHSPEGLVKVSAPWQYRIASNRDGRDTTLGMLAMWKVGINGFVDWFALERRAQSR